MRNVLWGLFILVAIGAMWVVFRTIGALLEGVLIGVIAGIVCGVIVIKFGQQPLTKRKTNRRKVGGKPRQKALRKSRPQKDIPHEGNHRGGEFDPDRIGAGANDKRGL